MASATNGIPTPNGGTHEGGLRSGVVKAVRNFIETHGRTPKGVSLTAEDIRWWFDLAIDGVGNRRPSNWASALGEVLIDEAQPLGSV
jgi:hypothetical protein